MPSVFSCRLPDFPRLLLVTQNCYTKFISIILTIKQNQSLLNRSSFLNYEIKAVFCVLKVIRNVVGLVWFSTRVRRKITSIELWSENKKERKKDNNKSKNEKLERERERRKERMYGIVANGSNCIVIFVCLRYCIHEPLCLIYLCVERRDEG